MREITEVETRGTITTGKFVAGFLIGFAVIQYSGRKSNQWLDNYFHHDGDIEIESGKEGIQPKHNLKPKLFQVTG